MSSRSFAALILTHGRPDRVLTYDTLRRCGYTGQIYLIVDNEDAALPAYREKYGKDVIVFDKREVAETFDVGDNFPGRRGVVYARNATFGLADSLGLTHFVQLDDDYNNFNYRFDGGLNYVCERLENLGRVFEALLRFLDATPFHAVAIAQGGDYLGGVNGSNLLCKRVCPTRKCMNSFFCRVDRPFQFLGRINEDTTTYTWPASIGLLMLTTNQVSIGQSRTQANRGGLTELYLDAGTYVKSFYSVMYHPSAVKIHAMGHKHMRLHHAVSWRHAVPKILMQSLRRTD